MLISKLGEVGFKLMESNSLLDTIPIFTDWTHNAIIEFKARFSLVQWHIRTRNFRLKIKSTTIL